MCSLATRCPVAGPPASSFTACGYRRRNCLAQGAATGFASVSRGCGGGDGTGPQAHVGGRRGGDGTGPQGHVGGRRGPCLLMGDGVAEQCDLVVILQVSGVVRPGGGVVVVSGAHPADRVIEDGHWTVCG